MFDLLSTICSKFHAIVHILTDSSKRKEKVHSKRDANIRLVVVVVVPVVDSSSFFVNFEFDCNLSQAFQKTIQTQDSVVKIFKMYGMDAV